MRADSVPAYLRLCHDGILLQSLCEYDEDAKQGHNAFTDMIVMLGKTIVDNPDVIGVRSDMQGLGISPEQNSQTSGGVSVGAGYLDLGLSVMSTAASAGVNTVNAMMSADAQELGDDCTPKVPW